jgi:hypothetical protein
MLGGKAHTRVGFGIAANKLVRIGQRRVRDALSGLLPLHSHRTDHRLGGLMIRRVKLRGRDPRRRNRSCSRETALINWPRGQSATDLSPICQLRGGGDPAPSKFD